MIRMMLEIKIMNLFACPLSQPLKKCTKKAMPYPSVESINNKLSPLCYNPHQPFPSPPLGKRAGYGVELGVVVNGLSYRISCPRYLLNYELT